MSLRSHRDQILYEEWVFRHWHIADVIKEILVCVHLLNATMPEVRQRRK